MVGARLVLDEMVVRVVVGLTSTAELEVDCVTVVVVVVATVVVLVTGCVGRTGDKLVVGFGFTVVYFKFANQKTVIRGVVCLATKTLLNHRVHLFCCCFLTAVGVVVAPIGGMMGESLGN